MGNELLLLLQYYFAIVSRFAYINQDVECMASKAQRAGSERTASSGARQLALFRAAENMTVARCVTLGNASNLKDLFAG